MRFLILRMVTRNRDIHGVVSHNVDGMLDGDIHGVVAHTLRWLVVIAFNQGSIQSCLGSFAPTCQS